MSRVLVALGGNAILRAHERGTWAESVRQMRRTVPALVQVARQGHELILTHGNGPQVGNLLREAELGATEVPAPPMHVLGAESEGQVGYLIAQVLGAELRRRHVPRVVVTIISQTEVSPRDPAFRHPTKPVGRFYTAREARRLRAHPGWVMRNDPSRGGWRRLVPSPQPLRWVEGPAVRRMFDAGLGARFIPVVAGGGGIPVVRDRDGSYRGVDAVIDKDRTAALVATELGADTLAVVTDVPAAAVGYETAHPRWLGEITARELKSHLSHGEFGEGSMGPKVEAGLSFLRHGGKRFIITNVASLSAALAGRAGTRVRAGKH
jgi:carbamate kinase